MCRTAEKFTAVLWLSLLLGCGQGDAVREGQLQELRAEPWLTELTAPLPPPTLMTILENRSGTALVLQHLGSEFSPGQTQNVSAQDTSARFNPAWTDATCSIEDVAWAVYSFNVAAYTGAEVIKLEWGGTPPAPGQAWLGLSHWQADCWDWFEVGPAGITDLSTLGYASYTKPGQGELLLAVVLLGVEPAQLRTVQVGEPSAEPIAITGITPSPACGDTSQELQFSVLYTGTDDETVTYVWDFGGGADPTISNEQAPLVTLSDGGVYDCSVTVDNAYGGPDTCEFQLTVHEGIQILGVLPNPTAGYTGFQLKLSVRVAGTEDTTATYAWDLGGGADPNNPAIKRPQVMLGASGNYQCSVTVDNAYGAESTYVFNLQVLVSHQGDWWMCGHDRQHTHRSTLQGPKTSHVAWTSQPNSWVYSAPAYNRLGVLYLGTNLLYASVRAINDVGQETWDYDTGSYVNSSPAVGPAGTVYIGSRDTGLFALSPTGGLQWSVLKGRSVDSSPVIGVDRTVYVGCSDGRLYAISPDGSVKWSYATGSNIGSSPALGLDGTIYCGSDNGKLYALDQEGHLKWSYQTQGAVFSSPAIDAEGTVHVGSQDGHVYALRQTGMLKWDYATDIAYLCSSPAIGLDGTVYIGGYDHRLHAINPDGSQKWTFLTAGPVYSTPALDTDGTVYFGSCDHNVYALGPDGSLLWSYGTGDIVLSSPVVFVDGMLLAASCDGRLYAFGRESHGEGEGESL